MQALPITMWRIGLLAVISAAFAGWNAAHAGLRSAVDAAPAAANSSASPATARITALEVTGDSVRASFVVTASEPTDFRCLRIEVTAPDGSRRDLAHHPWTHVEGSLELSGEPAHYPPGEYVAQVVASRDGLTWNSLGAPEHFSVPAP